MKAFAKSFGVLLILAAFFCTVFLLKNTLSLIMVLGLGLATTVGVILYFMYHHWKRGVRQQYEADVNQRNAAQAKREHKADA